MKWKQLTFFFTFKNCSNESLVMILVESNFKTGYLQEKVMLTLPLSNLTKILSSS